MKNEQRYGGIIQAQMKDLGVLLPRGRERGGQGDGGGEVWKKNWKKTQLDCKNDCAAHFVFVPFLFA